MMKNIKIGSLLMWHHLTHHYSDGPCWLESSHRKAFTAWYMVGREPWEHCLCRHRHSFGVYLSSESSTHQAPQPQHTGEREQKLSLAIALTAQPPSTKDGLCQPTLVAKSLMIFPCGDKVSQTETRASFYEMYMTDTYVNIYLTRHYNSWLVYFLSHFWRL